MAEEKGIKETLELITAIKDLGVDAKKIWADGKISAEDLPVAMTIVTQMGDFTAAISGADQIPAEVKDLSADELQQVGAAFVKMISEIRAA